MMRSATELQGNEAAKRTARRSEKLTAKHFELVGHATNDAVRDWNVKTGTLSWPQGLKTLLGYDSSNAARDIAFWQKQVHPQDRTRTARSIRDAIASSATHWTGEYRFRRVDGSYLDLLERAVIVRDTAGRAL